MDAGTPLPKSQATASISGRGSGEWVLVVDDALPLRRLVCMVLSQNGYQVAEANGGRSALDILEAQGANMQLVISDLLMPEMDGFTLIYEAKKLNPQLRFLPMTGSFTFEEIEDQLIQLGLGKLLHKPFNHLQLLNAVEAVLKAPECSKDLASSESL